MRSEHDGRVMMGAAGLLMIPLTLSGVGFLFFGMPFPKTPLDWCVRILLDELAISGSLFFCLGFLWAISGSRRVKRWLDHAAIIFAWMLLPMTVPVFAGMAWFLYVGK